MTAPTTNIPVSPSTFNVTSTDDSATRISSLFLPSSDDEFDYLLPAETGSDHITLAPSSSSPLSPSTTTILHASAVPVPSTSGLGVSAPSSPSRARIAPAFQSPGSLLPATLPRGLPRKPPPQAPAVPVNSSLDSGHPDRDLQEMLLTSDPRLSMPAPSSPVTASSWQLQSIHECLQKSPAYGDENITIPPIASSPFSRINTTPVAQRRRPLRPMTKWQPGGGTKIKRAPSIKLVEVPYPHASDVASHAGEGKPCFWMYGEACAICDQAQAETLSSLKERIRVCNVILRGPDDQDVEDEDILVSARDLGRNPFYLSLIADQERR